MNCTDVEELSSSYLAGGLSTPVSAEFAAHVQACASCKRVVEMDTRLRRAMLSEAVDSSAIDASVKRRIGGSVRRRRVSIAAGIAAMLIAAVFIYRNAIAVNPVYADAALDHRQEVVEHEPRTWVSGADAIMALGDRQGLADPALAAFSPQGYRLEGARLCRLNGKVFLHLVYTNGQHEISVFMCRPDRTHARSAGTARVGSEYVAAFETERVSGLVVAEQSRDRAVAVARYASSVL
jgi:anti-sigma factor RsiW